MPWEIKENNGQYCIYKMGLDVPVKGGCHSSRVDAIKHMRALYAAEPTLMKYSVLVYNEDLLEATDDPNIKWLKAWRYSKWEHPKYGEIEITPQVGIQFKSHFDSGTLGRDHLINYDHGGDPAKGGKAAGQILDIEPRDDGIYYKVQFTDVAKAEIQNGEWRYLSPEYDDYYLDPESGDVFENVPFDLALTNTPFFKGMPPLNFSEVYEFADISVAEKNNLPDSAFLYIEPGGKKDGSGKTVPRSLRHLPVHDDAHLRNAIARLSQTNTGSIGSESWLTDNLRKELLAKARAKLSNKPKGGKAVENELLLKFAEKLGISFDGSEDEETVLAAAEEFNKITEPLRNAKKDGERSRTFREAFPDEYKEMQKLRESRVEQDAMAFADGYTRFTLKDGDSEYKSVLGFSQAVKEKITEVHKKFSDRTANHRDLKELLDLIGDKGIVDYSEHGSSRTDSTHREFSDNPRIAFAEAVQDVIDKDGLEYEAAVRAAQQKFPKLFEDYVRAIPQR